MNIDPMKSLSIRTAELDLSARTSSRLRQHNIQTLGELAEMTTKKLSQKLKLGKKSIFEVRKILEEHGLSLVDSDTEGKNKKPSPSTSENDLSSIPLKQFIPMNSDLACKIYDAIRTSSYPDLVDDLVQYAVRYAQMRVEWKLKNTEERRDMDMSRTRAHNAFIDSCNILSRNMAKLGEDITWRDLIGKDRKVIGDFACHLHCLLGIKAR